MIYQERLKCKRVRKIRLEDQVNDNDSVHHVPDRDLKEEVLEWGFLLNEVINWEPFTNPFGSYTGDYPPLTAVECNTCDVIVLMSFDEFDKVMCDFINKQNRYASNAIDTKEFITGPR